METLNVLDEFLDDYEQVGKMLTESNSASKLTNLRIGALVKCSIKYVSPKNECVMELMPSGAMGCCPPHLFRDGLQEGDDVQGRILWLDYRNNRVIVALKSNVINAFSQGEEHSIDSNGIWKKRRTATMRILYVNKQLAIGVLPKSYGPNLIYLPVKLHNSHFNIGKDFYNDLLLKKVRTKIVKMPSGRMLGMIKQQKVKNNMTKTVQTKKTPEIEPPPTKKVKESVNSAVPDMSSFFVEAKMPIVDNSEDLNGNTTQTKKKLTKTQKAQMEKTEEARLRKIETELADASILPQSAEQFDRALMGNPDDSELWTQYIAFHMQSTEFEKARGVARRALERISYNAFQERLNVWLALLHLENMYGTKESFDNAVNEAARCNDALTIYLETIKMLASVRKIPEMEEKIKKVKSKFSQELEMWLSIGKLYYEDGRLADARKFKNNALLTLQDKKKHVYLIVQYAIMEFNYGEENYGEALFEAILQADPKRVDVWTTYVDQLVKKKKIDIARNVLQRAVGQKLIYKRMKTLFKKLHAFEQEYGNEESQQQVATLLQEYCK